MSYTNETLANDAFEKLKAINPQAPESLVPRLVTMIPSALLQMAERISRSSLAELLRTTFSVTAVSGEASLDSAINAAEPLLINSKLEVFLPSSTYPLEPVPDRSSLQIENSVEFGFYCVEGHTIFVREPNADYGAYSGDVTIIGARIPLSSTVPLQLEGELLATLVGSLTPQGA